MKNLKKINTLFMTMLLFQPSLYPANKENHQLHVDLDLDTTKEQNSESREFPTYTTDKYIYNREVLTYLPGDMVIPFLGNVPGEPAVSAQTTAHIFNNGITRTKVTMEINDGLTVYVIETWTSRNPSYLTWTNAAIAAAVVTGWRYLSDIQALDRAQHALDKTYETLDMQQAIRDENHPARAYYIELYKKLPTMIQSHIKSGIEKTVDTYKKTKGWFEFEPKEITNSKAFLTELEKADAEIEAAAQSRANHVKAQEQQRAREHQQELTQKAKEVQDKAREVQNKAGELRSEVGR